MQCSYCNIAYALPDPNCRGCGAPKTAEAVRRDLDRENNTGQHALTIRLKDDRVDGFLSHLERLQRLGSGSIAAIVVTILGVVLLLGPFGLITLAILLPKALAAKAEYVNAVSLQRTRCDEARAFQEVVSSPESTDRIYRDF